LPETVVDEMV